MNVKWVKDYIKSLTNVTCIMVSHDSGADSASHALRFLNLNFGKMASSRRHVFMEPSTCPSESLHVA